MDLCKHVMKMRLAKDHSILNPQKWLCVECGTTESVYACLSCSNIACGRINQKHALQHFQDTQHPIALEVNEKYVYCYVCQDYILNDNDQGDIENLRNLLSAIATQKFDNIQLPSPRSLLFHSASFSGLSINSQQFAQEDRNFTASKHWNLVLLSKVFSAWHSFVQLQQKVKKQLAPEKPKPRDLSPLSSPKRCTLIPGVTGLRNLGNTCYMNSILQVLAHIDKFQQYFHQLNPEMLQLKIPDPVQNNRFSRRHSSVEYYQQRSIRQHGRISGGLNGGGTSLSRSRQSLKADIPAQGFSGNSLSLCKELRCLFGDMWSGKNAQLSPQHMLSAVWNVIPAFRGYTQQDAQEFLCEFLDKVHCELESSCLTSKRRYLSSNNKVTSPISTIVTETFEGQLVSEVHCLACNNCSQMYEPFLDLSLEFPEKYHQVLSEDSCDLLEMLAKFTEEEALGDVYACDYCNNKRRKTVNKRVNLTKAKKRLLINKLPLVLRLHLKRFRWSGRNHREKINVHVDFPREVNMAPYCSQEIEVSNFDYQLTAVVMHHGKGFGSGHYTTYCWNQETEKYVEPSKDGRWVFCNDNRLHFSDIEDVFKVQAYILFYTKKSKDFEHAQHSHVNEDLNFNNEVFPLFVSDDSDDEISFNFSRIANKRPLFSEKWDFIHKRRRTTL